MSYWQSDPPGELRIPVARPRLPTAAQIAPYLRRIDDAQWYSNSGPLVHELEARLAQHCGPGADAASVCNATIGLTLALLAHDLPPGQLCMVPAWTFAATAHAVELAGLVPWIVDVAPESWALEATAARDFLRAAPGPVAAIMPVSPFGAPLDFAPWEEFREETGLAVVVDAAAAFDTIRASEIPTVVSLHATKLLGAGEGGFVVSTSASFAEGIRKRMNFGFWNSRESKVRSLNGKVSEYTAAVGLSALDRWPETRRDFERVARSYAAGLARESSLKLQPDLGDSWVTSTIVLEAPAGRSETIALALADARIGTRRWWGGGLSRHRAFAHCPKTMTRQTDLLADSTIGLPCYRDLADEEIAEISEIILTGGRTR